MIFIRNGQHAEASYMLRGGGWKGEREIKRERERGRSRSRRKWEMNPCGAISINLLKNWSRVRVCWHWRRWRYWKSIWRCRPSSPLLVGWQSPIPGRIQIQTQKKKRQPQNQSNDSRRKETGGGLLPVKVWKPQRRPCRPLGVWRWWCRRTPAGVADSAAAFWKCELWFSRRLWGRGFFRAHLCPLFRECSPNLLGRRLLQSVGIVVSMDITETAKIQLKIEDLPVRTSCDSAASSFRSERSAPSYGGRVCRLASYEEPPEERPEAWWLSREVALAGGPVCVRPPHARIVR